MIALVLAVLLVVDHQYIIPLIGGANGANSESHYAIATMLNPTARTATVRRTALFPGDCAAMTKSWELAPHAKIDIGFPFDSNCTGIAALTMVSDEPLYVTGSILTFSLGPNFRFDRQFYDAPQEWIEAGVDAATSGVSMEEPPYRANLLVINPNPEPLIVEAHLTRPEYGATRVDTFEVPPATVRLFAIVAVEDPGPFNPFPHIINGEHDIIVRGNRRFWAGVSSIDLYGGNTFRKVIPLEP